MSYRLSTQAVADLESILLVSEDTWGASHADCLAADFTTAFRFIGDFPGAGRLRPDLAAGLRSHPRHPFVLIYRIEHDDAVILRTLHGRRDAQSAISEFEFE